MKIIALRVDVDTLDGSLNGIPKLLKVFDRHKIQASFYFCFGPDNSGKAIRRIFRKGFLSKMLRTNAVEMYGIKTMLYGTILPAPIIWQKAGKQIKQVQEAGHEVAIHGWDHVQYHDLLDYMSLEQLTDWIAKAHDAFFNIFGVKAKGSVSPAWRCNDVTLSLQEGYNLEYAGDCRGTKPFYPLINGKILNTLQIPTTLPTMDELLGLYDNDLRQINKKLFTLIHDNALNVYTLHTEVEGNLFTNHFESFLQGLRDRGIDTCTQLTLARNWKKNSLPSSVISRKEIVGRSGWVSFGPVDEGFSSFNKVASLIKRSNS